MVFILGLMDSILFKLKIMELEETDLHIKVPKEKIKEGV